ncbi:DUF4334 domain-containing protein [Indiicoccus explosivorum]|uniref:DUF4334 domain-containing protein n=1 Tax=Indiicoccus explosivorum TaxID=1917864 RepID=UPI000B446800|nr:DUF4334 domain-containing protein [Indiicoccus explosivorum]
MNARQELDRLRNLEPAPRAQVFRLFDRLEGTDPAFMTGLWKGAELKTGHPMDGLLEASGWFGKRITGPEAVDPLVFRNKTGKLFRINPGLLPLSVPFGILPRSLVRRTAPDILPLLKTQKSRARIRMMEHRGATAAAMLYDQLPIVDVFRKVDDCTVLGMMDMKGQQPYFFILERVRSRQ